MQPFVVLDNNVLRDERLVAGCISRFRRTGELIALPSSLIFEWTKHPDAWRSTVLRSLHRLAQAPDGIVMAHSSRRLVLVEESTGTPTHAVIDAEGTRAIRRILTDVSVGGGREFDLFCGAIEEWRGSANHEGHANESLQTMQSLKAIARPSVPVEMMAAIGHDLAVGDRSRFREMLCATLLIEQQRDSHVRRGVSTEVADALLAAPSVSYLFALALGAIALEWVFKGGVESAKPVRVANDVVDIEYVLAAFWVGRLVSTDAGARARFDDLRELGRTSWPAHRAWFSRAVAFSPEEALGSFLSPA